MGFLPTRGTATVAPSRVFLLDDSWLCSWVTSPSRLGHCLEVHNLPLAAMNPQAAALEPTFPVTAIIRHVYDSRAVALFERKQPLHHSMERLSRTEHIGSFNPPNRVGWRQ